MNVDYLKRDIKLAYLGIESENISNILKYLNICNLKYYKVLNDDSLHYSPNGVYYPDFVIDIDCKYRFYINNKYKEFNYSVTYSHLLDDIFKIRDVDIVNDIMRYVISKTIGFNLTDYYLVTFIYIDDYLLKLREVDLKDVFIYQ